MSIPPICEVPSLREIIVRQNLLAKKLPLDEGISLDVQKIIGSVHKDMVKGLPPLKGRLDPINTISSLCLQAEEAITEHKLFSGHSLRSQILTLFNPFESFETDLLATTKSWLSQIPTSEHLKNQIQTEISQFIDELKKPANLDRRAAFFYEFVLRINELLKSSMRSEKFQFEKERRSFKALMLSILVAHHYGDELFVLALDQETGDLTGLDVRDFVVHCVWIKKFKGSAQELIETEGIEKKPFLDLMNFLCVVAATKNPNILNVEVFKMFGQTSRCQAIQLALAAGMNPDIKNSSGDAFLHSEKNPKIVQLLLEAGADPNVKNSWGSTPLHFATDPEIVQLLLASKADPDIRNHYESAPLHTIKDCEIIQLLLNAGADPNIKGMEGNTPLHLAKDVKIIQLLLKAGANPNIKNLWDRTPQLPASM